jgi:glycosyltransferase involved in cell wall biosynthesis
MAEQITGIQRFAYEMCKALINNGVDITILAPKKIRNEYQLNCPIIKFGVLPGIMWEHFDLQFYLWFHKCPLLVNFGSPGPLFYKNRIVSIHDISFYINPAWFSWWYSVYYRSITSIFSKRSKKIITVSEFSKSEIIKKLKIDSSKIIVIHNAVSQAMINTKQTNVFKEDKYILTVGSLDPRKNLNKLVEAYNSSENRNDVKLYIVGKSSPMFNMKSSNSIEDNTLGYVSDEELVSLYKNASAFIYLSYYEGFGIPPLEAMSFGCPVILSDIPVFREIYGESALFVNPDNITEINTTINSILSNNEQRKHMISKGYEKVKEYSWDLSAIKLTKLIESFE